MIACPLKIICNSRWSSAVLYFFPWSNNRLLFYIFSVVKGSSAVFYFLPNITSTRHILSVIIQNYIIWTVESYYILQYYKKNYSFVKFFHNNWSISKSRWWHTIWSTLKTISLWLVYDTLLLFLYHFRKSNSALKSPLKHLVSLTQPKNHEVIKKSVNIFTAEPIEREPMMVIFLLRKKKRPL